MDEKEFNLICEFCDNWFIDKKVQSLENGLIQDLKSKGYNVKLIVHPSNSQAKPYYIYLQKGNINKIILSNNANLHRKEGAIIDYSITKSNQKKVVDKIISEIQK